MDDDMIVFEDEETEKEAPTGNNASEQTQNLPNTVSHSTETFGDVKPDVNMTNQSDESVISRLTVPTNGFKLPQINRNISKTNDDHSGASLDQHSRPTSECSDSAPSADAFQAPIEVQKSQIVKTKLILVSRASSPASGRSAPEQRATGSNLPSEESATTTNTSQNPTFHHSILAQAAADAFRVSSPVLNAAPPSSTKITPNNPNLPSPITVTRTRSPLASGASLKVGPTSPPPPETPSGQASSEVLVRRLGSAMRELIQYYLQEAETHAAVVADVSRVAAYRAEMQNLRLCPSTNFKKFFDDMDPAIGKEERSNLINAVATDFQVKGIAVRVEYDMEQARLLKEKPSFTLGEVRLLMERITVNCLLKTLRNREIAAASPYKRDYISASMYQYALMLVLIFGIDSDYWMQDIIRRVNAAEISAINSSVRVFSKQLRLFIWTYLKEDQAFDATKAMEDRSNCPWLDLKQPKETINPLVHVTFAEAQLRLRKGLYLDALTADLLKYAGLADGRAQPLLVIIEHVRRATTMRELELLCSTFCRLGTENAAMERYLNALGAMASAATPAASTSPAAPTQAKYGDIDIIAPSPKRQKVKE